VADWKAKIESILNFSGNAVYRDEVLTLAAELPQRVARGRVRRNGPCPCGSGQKFKTCHLEAVRAAEIQPVRWQMVKT
jgi:uncharacterized protein YecA (UPF0149 family)